MLRVLVTVLGVLVTLSLTVAKGYKYDTPVVYDFSSYQEYENEMMYRDESSDAMLSKSAMVVGVYSRYCKHVVDAPNFRGLERFGGIAVKMVTVPAEGFIYALDECAELFYYVKGKAMPYGRSSNFDYLALKNFMSSMRFSRFNVTNHFDYPVEVFTADEDAGTVSQGILQAKETEEFTALYGTVFMASALQPESFSSRGQEIITKDILDFFLLEDEHHELHPNHRLNVCQAVNEEDPSAYTGRSLATPTTDTGGGKCTSLDERWKVWFIEIAYQMRVMQNYLQPQVVRPVTEAGFELRRMPEETFSWLKEFYYESGEGVKNATNGVTTTSKRRTNLDTDELKKAIGVLMEESMAGTCLNQIDVPTEIKSLPIDLKTRLVKEVGKTFEEWYGGKLIATSIYGVRRYFEGSILRMHVDTIVTHAVSAIINIGQQVDEDWPLVILDHQGREHSITMEPGDLLLYESAKLVHGRPSLLKGDYYDNLFIHFMPVYGWEGEYTWF